MNKYVREEATAQRLRRSRTETKATTTWPLDELLGVLPKMFHPALRRSRYYARGSDSLTFQAQTHRSRTANTDENRRKLMDEIRRLYTETVPGETSSDTKAKYEALCVALETSPERR